jgi:hypothetical protein
MSVPAASTPTAKLARARQLSSPFASQRQSQLPPPAAPDATHPESAPCQHCNAWFAKSLRDSPRQLTLTRISDISYFDPLVLLHNLSQREAIPNRLFTGRFILRPREFNKGNAAETFRRFRSRWVSAEGKPAEGVTSLGTRRNGLWLLHSGTRRFSRYHSRRLPRDC